MEKQTVGIIGSGIAGLVSACLLTHAGKKCMVYEQNWLPGGCASSYPRKNYIFESGATTLVGLEVERPLGYVLSKIGVSVPAIQLDIPMKVYLKNGQVITRYADLESWIAEAERVFGKANQRAFWEYCFKISEFVWDTALVQRAFPPANFADALFMLKQFRFSQLSMATLGFQSMEDVLRKFNLDQHESFCEFVDEQLLITAQNHRAEVNVLFGATALCYTLSPNYYVPGGMISMVNQMVKYLEENGSEIKLREGINAVVPEKKGYTLETKKGRYQADQVISAIPLNNTLDIWQDEGVRKKLDRKLMKSEELNSAFSFCFVAKRHKKMDCIHHQIHVDKPLPYIGSKSIFLSLSHPDDHSRCGEDEMVGSVSTHIPDPANTFVEDKAVLEQAIIETLAKHDLLQPENMIFQHASTPKAWKKWTGRSWGFVGGYPQYMRIKPWQMLNGRLNGKGAYICGDSAYPGQGIPGAALSGIIAVEKMRLDGYLS